MNWKRFWRKVHYWGAIVVALPLIFVIVSGLLLQVKKKVPWVQPTEMRGQGDVPTLSFQRILEVAKQVPEAKIKDWKDIDRLDVRPGKGIIKIRAESNWEIQIDHQTGKVLHVAYRRSDTIEDIHDGSLFVGKGKTKLWIYVPFGIVMLVLWMTGIYLFILPFPAKKKRREKKELQTGTGPPAAEGKST
jgi:uncharacterized iron-regulated membrane protein